MLADEKLREGEFRIKDKLLIGTQQEKSDVFQPQIPYCRTPVRRTKGAVMRSSSRGKRGKLYSVLMRCYRNVAVKRRCSKEKILEAFIPSQFHLM